MARQAVTGLVPQYAKNASGDSASGYWLKFYFAGTTTPITIYTDIEGGVGLAKCRLNTRGEPISDEFDDDSIFIPYIDGDYDGYLFFTEQDADDNNTIAAQYLGRAKYLPYPDAVQADIDAVLESAAQGNITPFDAGTDYTTQDDWVEYPASGGAIYRPKPSALPIAAGAFDSDDWVLAQIDSVYTVDSIAALIGGSFSNDQIYVRSYYGGWEGTAAGPQGGFLCHKTGATNASPTVGTAVSAGSIGGGDGSGDTTGQSVQDGYFWGADGAEFRISDIYEDALVNSVPYLKTTSDIISGLDLSIDRFIPKNLLSSIRAKSIDDSIGLSTYFNNALENEVSIFVPYGKYPIDNTIAIKSNGQSLYGCDGTNSANLVATLNNSSNNMIELYSGRRDTGNDTLTVTNQFLKNFRISSPSGSDYNSIIWVESGCFHGMIEQLRIENLRGAVPTSAVVKFDSNGGQSYPVHMGMRDVTITGGLNDDLSPILRGIWLESAIEGYFDNVFVYTVEEAWVLGTSTNSNIRNVQNCTFVGCQGEIGDRGYASDTATALRIYQGRDIDFISCKFLSGADFGSPSNQNCVRFSQDPTSTNRNIKFRDTALWGQGGANYLIRVDGSVTDTFDVKFYDCDLVEPVLGILTADQSTDIGITWGEQTYVNCAAKFAKFKCRRFTVNPSSMNDGGSYLATLSEDVTPVGAAPTLISYGASLQGVLVSGYKNSTNGTYRVRFQNESGSTVDLAESSLRVRHLTGEEIKGRQTYRYDPAAVSSGTGTTEDWYFQDVSVGDFVVAAFLPEQSGTLDQLLFDAYVSSSGVVSTRLQNQTGSSSNLAEGDMQILKLGDFDAYGQKTYNAPSIASQSQTTTTVNVPGVGLGDFVVCSLNLDLQGLTVQCYVSSNDVATVVLFNGTGSPIDLASTTLRVAGYKRFHEI